LKGKEVEKQVDIILHKNEKKYRKENMSKIFIKELKDHLNKEIISNFLVTEKILREGAKDFYIRLKLADSSGSIAGNVWNNAKTIAEKFDEGDVIQVNGFVITYKAQLQLTVNKLKKISQEEYDLQDFLETTTKDIKKLSDKLFSYIDSIKNQYLKELLLNIFEDKEFFTKFGQAPAAKGWHHNYIGGLLEHSMSVTGLCDYTSHNYKVDRDLLITGAILHDIGKVFEYQVVPNIDFTPVGRLVGHMHKLLVYSSLKMQLLQMMHFGQNLIDLIIDTII
jgi:3'-5' exoribonuclease